MRDSVVLPAPDGDDNTNISPRRSTSLVQATAARDSFEILHLLAKLLDDVLHLQCRSSVNSRSLDFEQRGVDLAVEFLRKEIEPAPDRAALGQHSRACATCEAMRSSSSRMSAFAAIIIASWCRRSASKRSDVSSSAATCSASRALIASGLRPGAASAFGRAARSRRSAAVKIRPSAVPSRLRMAIRLCRASSKPAATAPSAAAGLASSSSGSTTSITPLIASSPSTLGGAAAMRWPDRSQS